MTTIVYRDGVMAADTLVTDAGSVRRGTARKIFRTANGALVGVAGASGLTSRFVQWIENGEPEAALPRMPDGQQMSALVAYSDGSVAVFNETLLRQKVVAPFEAVGSGNEIALGALAMGARAEEAVLVACQFDVWSAEPVDSLRLGSSID